MCAMTGRSMRLPSSRKRENLRAFL
jgi:hypothetical protein